MVKRLIRHWTLFSVANSTSADTSLAEDEWRDFLANNTDFIRPMDFVRDMAVEDPGSGPVLMAK